MLVFDFWLDNLGPDPIRASILRTGKTALILLLLSLGCSPINTIFKFRPVIRLRRPLGIYAVIYAGIHLLLFVGVDYGFNLELLKDALLEKRYAIVGLTTFSILLPMAITSTKRWKKRLGKNWKHLHRLIYPASILAIVHFIWLVKQGVIEPWYYAGIVVILLTLRLPFLKRYFANIQFRRFSIVIWLSQLHGQKTSG
jgi:sulfoxide reductase heme-binding subunit YedZ